MNLPLYFSFVKLFAVKTIISEYYCPTITCIYIYVSILWQYARDVITAMFVYRQLNVCHEVFFVIAHQRGRNTIVFKSLPIGCIYALISFLLRIF